MTSAYKNSKKTLCTAFGASPPASQAIRDFTPATSEATRHTRPYLHERVNGLQHRTTDTVAPQLSSIAARVCLLRDVQKHAQTAPVHQ